MKSNIDQKDIMKHPWWLVNSTLLVLCIAAFIFIFASRQRPPVKAAFRPDAESKPLKKEIAKIDVNKIFMNDLFDTYQAPRTETQEPIINTPLPPPPVPQQMRPPPVQTPRFLEPLNISLKGIIIGSDESLNIAIIEDVKERRSKNYKINDRLEDAQLIRILKNKIILIRSNGQQETLYVSQHDAEVEELLSPLSNWTTIIKKTGNNTYSIDPELFVERVKSLAQFIDLLSLTTVYKQGVSIGCRVGKLQPGSPGLALGLIPGDIIESVNNISIAETSKRFDVYKMITAMQPGDTITVQLLRKKIPLMMIYTLEKLERPSAQPLELSKQLPQPATPVVNTQEQAMNISSERHRFNPMVTQMQKKEKQHILNKEFRRAHMPSSRNILINNVEPDRMG